MSPFHLRPPAFYSFFIVSNALNFYHEIKCDFLQKFKFSSEEEFVSKLIFFNESKNLSSTEKNCKVYENDFNIYCDLISFR